MKKICILTAGIVLIAANVFAAPQTDIAQGKTAIDIGAFNAKDSMTLMGNDIDFGNKTNINFGVTTGISDKYAVQYKYNSLDSGHYTNAVVDTSMKIKTQEFNVLYKLTKNTDAFIGVHKFSGTLYVHTANVSGDFDNKNKMQIGVTTTVPLGEKLNAWGTLSAGDNLISGELGVSHPLNKNTDLNLYYRYTKEKDLTLNGVPYNYDIENNGFGLGVTMKF